MTLSNNYSIATRHQRSTRIDSDLNAEFFPGLVYHGTAQSSLETLFRQYSQTGQSAYTLTGPYGSGKSTVALLMAGLLHPNSKIRVSAISTINEQSTQLLKESIPYKNGWLQIRSVGGVRGPVESFWDATLKALAEHPNTNNNTALKKYIDSNVHTESKLISSWKSLFFDIANLVDGVLIIADEMGKSLEYINRNDGDLHLFQDIAEELSRINTPVIFLGLLHQSFSEYAKERGTKLQDEWAKIQGRYTDILYNVSTDETVALISNSITIKEEIRTSDQLVNQVLASIDDKQQRKDLLHTRLEQCIPLHPLTALLLGPIAKRRFSQNERSTFSFLNSREQFSFQLFLQQTSDNDARYTLNNLWDYLEANMEHSILSSPDGHGWATAADAIRKALTHDFPTQCIDLLKAISLITLFGKAANLTATEKILLTVTKNNNIEQLQDSLQMLKNASCIVYRKHLSAWVVFEGSDLDIAALIEDKVEQLRNSNEAIERIDFSAQVIAKGHYHDVGTLRWASQEIALQLNHVDFDLMTKSRNGEFGNFLLLLKAEPKEQLERLTRTDKTLMIACATNANEIIGLANERYALDLIKSDKITGAALTHDKVAREEHRVRTFNTQSALETAIALAFNSAQWVHNGKTFSKSTLSEIATSAANSIFHKTPRIHNELVNRNKLSGTAVSALKKLLEAMLNEEDSEDLGIDGFPPEKSMYISCLKNTYVHSVEGENGLHWFIDDLDNRLNAVFSAAEKMVKEHKGSKVSLSRISEIWSGAPFGLTKGVIPIFILAFLKSMGDQVAYYEKDMSGDFAFIAEPDSDYVHKLIKNSSDLAVQYIVLEKEEQEWLQHLAVFAATETNRDISCNILSVATPLVTTIHNLPAWVKNAHNIYPGDNDRNKVYLKVRDLFLQANDPHTLLIVELRNQLKALAGDNISSQIDLLAGCFKTLRQKHEQMLFSIKEKVLSIFPESGEELANMCSYVENNSGDLRLKAFARELAKSDTGLLQWLENMIQIVIGRGKQNWNEGILQTASNKISEYSQDFLSVAKSQHKGTDSTSEVKTKLVSLVLEGDDGKLTSFKKEIRAIEMAELQPTISILEEQLSALDEFHKINVLQQLLKKSLDAQN
ncbi:MAG: hypothetical protein ACRDC6_09735 [Shewanella sp.]|uniref:hypothetical protein n=1 Tax=Plesiomonas shigelloides TaxID=703 RepID=UPI00126184CE|nr:hypothetical protein [Plesiomonas shigelloides]KAB7653196.1 hypothetical protein GBN14_15290 [Plesiomonas shigelloides]